MNIWVRIAVYCIGAWGVFNLLFNRSAINRILMKRLTKREYRTFLKHRNAKEWWMYTSVKHVLPKPVIYYYYLCTFFLYPIEAVILVGTQLIVGTGATDMLLRCFLYLLIARTIIIGSIEEKFY